MKEKNYKKRYLITMVFILILIISVGSGLVYGYKRYINLRDNYNSLSKDYSSLKSDYNILSNEYDSMEYQLSKKKNEYTALKSDFDDLQWDYNSLQSNYNNLLEENLGYSIRYGDGSDCELFITPNDYYVNQKMYSILNYNSDGDLTWEDIKAINNWVGNNINYNHDTFIGERRNCYQYPSETLELGWGDCEDHAVLMISLCKAEEQVSWMYCAIVEFIINGMDFYHACVFVDVTDDKLYILDPTDKPAWYEFWTDVWHSSSAKSEYDALNEYRTQLGASSIQVLKIFNEYTYYDFNNNQEFYNLF